MAETAQILEFNAVFQMADKLRALKERKETLEAELSTVSEELTKTDQEMVQEMINQELPKFTRSGKTFYMTTRIFASPVPEKKDDLFLYLNDNGFGGMVKLGVNANTLSSFVKEQLEDRDDLPEGLKELINWTPRTTIGMRKAGK